MKLLIINNLKAGIGDGQIYEFIRLLAKDGAEIVLRSTDGATRIENMLLDACDYDCVVASGGDGTIAAVCYALRYSDIPILPFPAGTANLLALNMYSPNETHALAKMLKEGKTLDFDIGEANIGGKNLGFIVMSGCGYDAALMRDAKPNKRTLGVVAYLSADFANVVPQIVKYKITIDDKYLEAEALGVILINFSKIQMDISLTNDNLPRDGKIALAILKGKTAFDLLPALIGRIIDKKHKLDKTDTIEVLYGSEINIESEPSIIVQHDGEVPAATTPLSARVLKRAARLIISDEAFDVYKDNPLPNSGE